MGKHGAGKKQDAVKESMVNGKVRGFYSDFILNPERDPKDSMYPSIDHVNPRGSKLVVEARVINDMKSHLTETEFWRVIEHLYAVGLEKNKIKKRKPIRLPTFRPENNY